MKEHWKKIFSGIQGKILKNVLALVVALLIILGLFCSVLNYTSTNATIEQTMNEMAELAAERVAWELEAYKNIVIDLGTIARMSSDSYTAEDKQELIDEKVQTYGLVRGKLISPDGIAYIEGTDYNERDYFKKSMQGEVCVTEPMIAKTSGKISVIFSAPVWKDGLQGGEVVGVVFVVPEETFLNDIVIGLQVSSGGSAYMLDAQGNTIAHRDIKLVETNSNTIQDAKSDSSLENLAKLETKMIKGEKGFGTYRYGGEKKFLAYAPIEGTNGWSIGINAPVNDFMAQTYLGIFITIVIIVVAIVISIIVAGKLASAIATPIKKLSSRLVTFAEGNLSEEFPKADTKDEVADMITVAGDMAENLTAIIQDSKHRLTEMAAGDYTLESTMSERYVGEFAGLDTSIHQLNMNMNKTLHQILEASGQVSSGSDNLAQAAQSLAEGATDQAGEVEELLATVTSMTQNMGDIAGMVEQAHAAATQYTEESEKSRMEIQNMVQIMNKITETSKNIESIITEIENIASQTNLLSLNASIEAARAGDAGRGFAVVADQIGKLAEESARSAVNTRQLILDSLSEIEKGSSAADQTAENINVVVNGIRLISQNARDVAGLVNSAVDSMKQTEIGVNQISEVVQANSATAEETSATSEELSAQAQSLDELVGNFRLKG